ncbi:L-glutamine:2-deoxy-scyllo-inosose aminotransferase [Pirellula sp. SH-Sr6A]|uniref:DegT/DnrJ/EryC1/StrS family aminotransferase n=1 Tax=Pirellula sp. SH-Sr6A TaxID=1632865 RepID=UPI00078D1C17|nr:aminotransferase class V-fold PLP-dependent enzyme [Pirellula sp. SH-Sr6A]AMV32541.1 L-glutamine:2-deoxy-scyllo-inosose aminotransferase [Pirellula sp. SH-Sr6A]
MTHPPAPRSLTALAVEESVRQCIASGTWRCYSGPNLERLAKWFCSTLGHRHVRFCSSGTLGIELALRSLHLRPDEEVLLCGYDYPGNFRAVEDSGARVVLSNPSPALQWSLDIDVLEQSVASETKAIIVSHLHGELAPVQRIVPWAHQRGITVIEDACQATGAMLQGRPIGSWGDLAVFSFGGSKLVSAGRGGVVLTSNDLLAQRMTCFCEKGNDAFAMSELQAAAIVPQCERLATDHRTRQQSAQQLWQTLSKFHWLRLPRMDEMDAEAAYYKLGMLCDFDAIDRDRERILTKWQEGALQVGKGFPGFASRSRKRYRSVDSMERSGSVAASTIVIHHAHLLDPLTGEVSVRRIIDAFEELEKEFQA